MFRDIPRRRRRGLLAAVAVVCAVPIGFFGVTMLPASAAVQPVADGVYTVATGASGKCLNVSTTGLLVQVACSTTTASQLWKATASGTNFTLVNSGSSQCVTVPDTTSGSQLSQAACGTATTQQWSFTASTAAAGKYVVKNASSGLCLSDKDGSTAGNNPIVHETCSDISRMQWSFNYVSGPTGTPSPTPCTGPSTPAPTPTSTAPVKVWMAGDSTMANASACPIGWGNQFAPYFNSNVTVQNSAVGGRSIQTWLYDGVVTSTIGSNGECTLSSNTYNARWTAMTNASTGMKAGDYLFIQFGINDGDTACPRHVGTARFKTLMTAMVAAAKAKGATPVLVTPVAAITCSGSTAVGNRGFVTETKAVATSAGVPVIDLHAKSVALYNTLKLCPNDGNYSTGAVGAFFCNDHTHFEAAGAKQIAGVVATALKDQKIGLASYLK